MGKVLHIRYDIIIFVGSVDMRKKGLVALYILEIIKNYANRTDRITQGQISEYLEEEYNIIITRKTLSGYLNELREEGYISGKRGVYAVNEFDDGELRLLIDSVLFGKHIPKDDANILIGKLKKQASVALRRRMNHVCYLDEINRTDNEKLCEIINLADNAIEQNRKIEITRCSYHTDGKLYDKGVSTVNPYYIVADKGRYYLICNIEESDEVTIRRLDRISDIKVLKDERTAITSIYKYSDGFDLGEFLKEHIYMTCGEATCFRLKIVKNRIGEFIDWFGKDFRISEEDEEYVIINIKANENAVYFWALQYGEIVEILSPVHMRERLKNGLKKMLIRYEY